ncbi:hypothetical protein SCYAM73S_03523 [Streptomyces cyaneofuscatus]
MRSGTTRRALRRARPGSRSHGPRRCPRRAKAGRQDGGRPDGSAVSLKPNAIGFVDALVIGLNATSPAYSLAA